ncbi:hypothetical protein Poly51_45150 [Rubripirellula tenax]|uniref:GIY-YIG domain-containing protein n=1 Tax=Rubripirellula tenax TaxID=2528015 RepID=A0A5C6EJD4_9BACT|nr:GIY-YIG nuclease family protein [Rubripirellula tenax]TWU48614.1 hypothetical protein Poly51_45150 [Rubripirellula tenax]
MFRWIITVCAVFLVCPAWAVDSAFSPDDIIAAVTEAGDGFSTDEILVRDRLRTTFLEVIARRVGHTLTDDEQRDVMLAMLKFRKAGKLDVSATHRSPPAPDDVAPVAEIAVRVVTDRHRVSSDTVLADPALRSELQSEAVLIRPGIDADDVRKSVLSLRKKRALKPELVLQVADWGRTIETVSLSDLKQQLEAGGVSTGPGVYLFRSERGYLYVGEASNLAARLTEHVGGSDRVSLAQYLAGEDGDDVTVEMHIFPSDSPARRVTVRRAYESELIRSRDPKFNVRP